MERLRNGWHPEEMKNRFKRLRRQINAMTRNGGELSENQVEEMLSLDVELAKMGIGWKRNFPEALLEENGEIID